MGRIKKPIWFDGKIYPSTTDLAQKTKISLKLIYECLNLDEPIKRNGHEIYLDYVITFDELQEYKRKPAFRKLAK